MPTIGGGQDYGIMPVRTAAILTNSYVAGTIIGADNLNHNELNNQLILLVDFTLGSLTNGEIKVEFSSDGTNYYQETFASITANVETDTVGTHQMTATGAYRIPIQTKDRFVKVSARGNGTVTSSSMKIQAIYGVA